MDMTTGDTSMWTTEQAIAWLRAERLRDQMARQTEQVIHVVLKQALAGHYHSQRLVLERLLPMYMRGNAPARPLPHVEYSDVVEPAATPAESPPDKPADMPAKLPAFKLPAFNQRWGEEYFKLSTAMRAEPSVERRRELLSAMSAIVNTKLEDRRRLMLVAPHLAAAAD